MERKYLRIRELASTPTRSGRWPVSPATIWRKVASGELAAPMRLFAGVSAWPLEVIEQYEAQVGNSSQRDTSLAKATTASVAARAARRAMNGGAK